MAKQLTESQKRTALSSLEQLSAMYEQELEAATAKVQEAERERDRIARHFDNVKNVLDDQQARLESQISRTSNGKYAGHPLREVAIRIIKERSPNDVSLSTMNSELNMNGYVIESQFPSRSLHAALIGELKKKNPSIEKTGSGTYRWRVGGEASE